MPTRSEVIKLLDFKYNDFSKNLWYILLIMLDFFKGRKLILATKHKKEIVMKPILKEELGVNVFVPDDYDTDLFGTFTGERERTGNQLEAAKKKALGALEKYGGDLVIASEGSFDGHPSIPWVISNVELVLLIDTKNDLEIRGHHRTEKTNATGEYVSNLEEAVDFSKRINFPSHGITVSKNKSDKKDLKKGINKKEDFEKIVEELFKKFPNEKIYLVSDLRAHLNPTRMEAIGLATEDLINNIKSLCPKCKIPGFVITDVKKGLPCKWCGSPTELPLSYVYSCLKCKFFKEKEYPENIKSTDPVQCNHCNP